MARDPKATPSDREFAKKLEAKQKYLVSTTRRDFPWNNTHHIEGDLTCAMKALLKATSRGLLVGSPKLSAALRRPELVDEYRFVVHPVVAGHGPLLIFRPAALITLEVRGRDTAQIGHRGVALSPALAALENRTAGRWCDQREFFRTPHGLASRNTYFTHAAA